MVGISPVSMISFTATGKPPRRPGLPALSDLIASEMALSLSTYDQAPTSSSLSSILSKQERIRASAVRSPDLIFAEASSADSSWNSVTIFLLKNNRYFI